MSLTHSTADSNDEGITLPHTVPCIDLNPAIPPWFPISEIELELGLYNLPEAALDPSLFCAYDYALYPNCQLPLTFFPENAVFPPDVQPCPERDSMFAIREELKQVKFELEEMSQRVAKVAKCVEETTQAAQDLRIDVNATEQWCQQFQAAFVENNQPEVHANGSRVEEKTPAP